MKKLVDVTSSVKHSRLRGGCLTIKNSSRGPAFLLSPFKIKSVLFIQPKITITSPQWVLESVQWTISSVLRASIQVRKKLPGACRSSTRTFCCFDRENTNRQKCHTACCRPGSASALLLVSHCEHMSSPRVTVNLDWLLQHVVLHITPFHWGSSKSPKGLWPRLETNSLHPVSRFYPSP